jgi:hypothetical protein
LAARVQKPWPRQLFVPLPLRTEALDDFLKTGKQKKTMHWIRTEAFPSEGVLKAAKSRR